MATTAISSEVSPRPAAWPGTLLLLGRVALGLIFLVAAYAKLHFAGEWHLRDYQFFFAMAIDAYKMLPISAVQWMAQILPWFELALGVLLIAGVAVRWIGSGTLRAPGARLRRRHATGQNPGPRNQLRLFRQQRKVGHGHFDSRRQPARSGSGRH